MRRTWSMVLLLGLFLAPQAISTVLAHGVTLKVQHPFGADSTFQTQFLIPWTQKLVQESGGRLHFHIEGGAVPAQLFDRAKSGEADLVWATIDALPGRFPSLEAFELPLMMNSNEGASRALWEYLRLSDAAHMELDGLRAVALHPCPPAQLHFRARPIASIDELRGLRVAARSQIAQQTIAAAGGIASPLGAALAEEADAILASWDMLSAIQGADALKFHAELDGKPPRVMSSIGLLVMNAGAYKALPDDLKKIVNANSGAETGLWVAKVLDASAAAARQARAERGDAINMLANPDATWPSLAKTASQSWIKTVGERGANGQELVDAAREALAEYDRAK